MLLVNGFQSVHTNDFSSEFAAKGVIKLRENWNVTRFQKRFPSINLM